MTGKRFDGWTPGARIRALLHMALWLMRGSIVKVGFRKSNGMTFIGPSVKILHRAYLTVGANFLVERGCEINCLSTAGIVMGDNVSIGSYAIIRPSNNYGGAIGEGLAVGNNSNIGPYSYIGCSGRIEIGENVMISPRVSIYSENHVFSETDVTIKSQGVKREFVRIEDDCWIASNSVILAGVTIGKGSVVAAGSVVTKDVPPYSVVGGNPAKVIKNRK